MKTLARAALVSNLRAELESRGNWTGETHLQKATFILQEAAGVPLGYTFILYKHGPFSFDLREQLNEMRADGLIRVEPQPPYGPKLKGTERSARLIERFPRTLGSFGSQVEAVSDLIGSKGVAELERLATAILLIKKSNGQADQDIAAELHEIKPHVSPHEAASAVDEGRKVLAMLSDSDSSQRGLG